MKTVQIKITSAYYDSYWYAKHIGEVFAARHTFNSGKEDWEVVQPNGEPGYVDAGDCKVLPLTEEGESKEKLRELILHVCAESESDETFDLEKLKAIIFQADRLAYLRTGETITGSVYVAEKGECDRCGHHQLSHRDKGYDADVAGSTPGLGACTEDGCGCPKFEPYSPV